MNFIVIILFCKLLQPLLNKKCSMALSDSGVFMKYMAIRQLAAAVIALFLCAGSVQTDFRMLLLGMIFAVCLTVCTYAGIAAMQGAAMVLVSMFEMAGLLVPCITGSFLFSEPLTTTHILGLLGCIFSAFLLTGGEKQKKSALSAKAWLLLLACLLSNGGIMLTQKVFAVSLPDGNVAAFHFWAFLFSGLFSAVLYKQAGRMRSAPAKISLRLGLYGVVLSAAMLVISMLSTLASEVIPAVVLFSMSNGGGLLLCTLISAFVYKEKITFKMVAGLLLGVAALMMINFA